MRMPEDQVLDDELDVDQTAAIVLDVEEFVAFRRVLVEHALAHRQHFVAQRGEIARLAQDLDPDRLELLADGRVAGTEAGARQRLMFPDPGVLQLVVAKGRDRTDEHPRVTVRTQPQVDLEELPADVWVDIQVLMRWPRRA
jgi:hypothetical protein